MATRFTDDLFHNTEGSDFIVRRRVPATTQIFLIFALACELVYITGRAEMTVLFPITVIVAIGGLAWFTIFSSATMRDLVLATEFQNAMLASAAQLSTRFCLITKRDGAIVYVDQGFQTMFPQFLRSNDRNVDGLFKEAGIGREAINTIILMLQHTKSDKIMLSMRADNNTLPIVLSVDALPRPKGYFLMRGRDYVEKRGTETLGEPAVLPGLGNALGLLTEGILVTDPAGIITYMNRRLETWLGYAADELLTSAHNAHLIIYQYMGSDPGKMIHEDFTGDVILRRKNNGLVTMHIRQAASGASQAVSAVIRDTDMPGRQ